MKKIIILQLFVVIFATASFAQLYDVRQQLKRHVEYLASDRLQGRRAGSEGERKAAEYLYKCLSDAGVIMLTDIKGQDFSIVDGKDTISSMNIVGIVEGYDPALREEYIVVGAHIDHLGTYTTTVDGKPVTQIYPGADDNASGVATMIELAKRVSECSFMFRRSIIFVGFGAEELVVAGSQYFVNRAFEGIGKVRAMINLDMLGRGNAENPFTIFSQVSQAELTSLMEEVTNEPIVQQPEIAQHKITVSDHLPFYNVGIPIVSFTTGMHREYHSPRDLPKFILYSNMESNCNYIFYFLKTLAGKDAIFPQFGKNQVVGNPENVYAASDCDKRPEFFHSDEKHFLETWVYKYIKYPKSAVAMGIKGVVTVSFIIEKDGSVTNVEVVRGVDDSLDDEAVKVVSVSPKWIPGQIKGKKVRTKIVLPIEFRLK